MAPHQGSQSRDLRQDLAVIQRAALDAVDPYDAVKRHFGRHGTALSVDGVRWMQIDTPEEHVWIVAVGKAAESMAAAAAAVLGDCLSGGVVVTKYGHVTGRSLPATLDVIEAGHPIPDESGLNASRRIINLLQQTSPDDLVLFLLSGGGSALTPSPVPGLDLQDLQETTNLLLRAGATIVEVNTVRKHLSQLKGGQLARLASPASVIAFILSDVVGDPLDVIASGPTSPDPTTYGDALAVLARYGLEGQVPQSVAAYLEAGVRGAFPETPKPGDVIFDRVINAIVGSNSLAAEAAAARARDLGYHSLVLTTFVEGEAREVAKVAVALAKELRSRSQPVSLPACIVWGGETTVTVRGSGKGGRNQELALSAAIHLEGMKGVALLALATDGTDGPTDAAGAVVDGDTARRARAHGLDPLAALQDNDAYPLLDEIGDLLRIGPTGTNVNDLMVLLVV